MDAPVVLKNPEEEINAKIDAPAVLENPEEEKNNDVNLNTTYSASGVVDLEAQSDVPSQFQKSGTDWITIPYQSRSLRFLFYSTVQSLLWHETERNRNFFPWYRVLPSSFAHATKSDVDPCAGRTTTDPHADAETRRVEDKRQAELGADWKSIRYSFFWHQVISFKISSCSSVSCRSDHWSDYW